MPGERENFQFESHEDLTETLKNLAYSKMIFLMALMILTNTNRMQEIYSLLKNQDSFFKSKKTLSINYRKESLIRLKRLFMHMKKKLLKPYTKTLKNPN